MVVSDRINIKKLVVKTLTKYGVDTVDVNSIKSIIASLGYTVIRYSSLGSSDQTQKLLEALYLDDRIAFDDSFTYNDKERRIVFIRRDVSDDEFLYLLAVELGRILTFKTEADGVVGISAEEDRLAHEFAYHISNLSRHGLLYSLYFSYKLPMIFATLGFTVCICLLISFFTLKALCFNGKSGSIKLESDSNNSELSIVKQEENSDVLNFTDDVSEDDESKLLKVQSEENEVISHSFYATKSGSKYHTVDCGYISGKDTVIVSQADIVSGRYSPCSRCID